MVLEHMRSRDLHDRQKINPNASTDQVTAVDKMVYGSQYNVPV